MQQSPTENLSKRSILVIDDSPDMLYLGRFILERDGFEVFTASSGAQALQILSEIAPPQLVLLDMQMADMNGHEFLKELEDKKPKIFEQVPVVFYSAENNIKPSHAKGFIRKAGDVKQFLASIHSFI